MNRLTKRELETLKYLKMGYTNPEISKILCISINTTKAHISSILRKLNVKKRLQAAVLYQKYEMKLNQNDKTSPNTDCEK